MELSKFSDYGVLKVEGRNAKIYSSPQYSMKINVGEQVKDARWSGDALIVSLENGKVRRYTSTQYYTTVY